ncbi:MAG: hypothetical protein IR153_01735 [Flavobacterium sp.]|nr:hypothetical protein [Flavobacterium sp.]
MKKVFLSAAFVLATVAVSAQTQNTTTTSTTTTAKTDSQVATKETEVKLSEVPTAITDAVKKDYPGATINSVTVNSAKEYTLNVTMGEQTGLIFSTADGKWIRRD